MSNFQIYLYQSSPALLVSMLFHSIDAYFWNIFLAIGVHCPPPQHCRSDCDYDLFSHHSWTNWILLNFSGLTVTVREQQEHYCTADSIFDMKSPFVYFEDIRQPRHSADRDSPPYKWKPCILLPLPPSPPSPATPDAWCLMPDAWCLMIFSTCSIATYLCLWSPSCWSNESWMHYLLYSCAYIFLTTHQIHRNSLFFSFL